MYLKEWIQSYPIFWINLERQRKRCMRMEWALEMGGWNHTRWDAIDAQDNRKIFISLERLWQYSNDLPGVRRSLEFDPKRLTTRAELACLASWQTLIEHLENINSASGWFLLMEDDVGSSLCCPQDWPFSLKQLTESSGNALIIQLAPINARTKSDLHKKWLSSQGKILSVPKGKIKSHGNGAILLHQEAIPFLKRHFGRMLQKIFRNFHLLGHPRNVRPVADKWLYASLPEERCWVCTYPLFCLEAEDSSLHKDHVHQFHMPSRDITLQTWESDGADTLLTCFEEWLKQ